MVTELIKGKTIKYIGKIAYCEACKSEIFVSDIRDFNLKALDTAFREEENLIKVEDIERILEVYDIGKRPLSLLLGWGEGTLTRYIDGDIPTKLYSDKLKRILKDRIYYLELLEKNKDNITDVAFRKSKKAINKKPISLNEKTTKIESVVRYLLVQTSEITPLALQKLLYFSQGFQKAFTNTFLFEEDCEAWIHGPVYRNVYNKYKGHGYNPIEEELSYQNIDLSEDEKELLDHIVLYFGRYSGKVLENMTHSEEPWRVSRHGLKDFETSNIIIEKKEIGSYFISVKEKYKMLNFTDIKDYSEDLISKLYS
jgi:uncharacterized phage-associated protein